MKHFFRLVTLKRFAAWSWFRYDDRLLLIVMGALVGICSGIAAVGLSQSLFWLWHVLETVRTHWYAFLLPAGGAVLSSLFLDKVMREGAGHGVPEVIYSVSRYGGLLRLRSSFSRLIASCLTIGSGGSAGPEAPVVMSGAAIGSNVARLFGLNDRQRITLVGCGAAGAIGGIFNAPIAGMIFTMEVVLGEWSAVNVIPIAIAAVAGTEISRILIGNQIAFAHQGYSIHLPDILACVGLAVFTAVLSVLLTRVMRRMHGVAHGVPLPNWVKAAIGGCAVGLMGMMMPEVLGEGYHFIVDAIKGNIDAGQGLYSGLVLAAVACFAKMIATSLTLGWGGSGGIFAPSLVVGAFGGLAYARLLDIIWPGVGWVSEGCFALLGMAGLIGGILQAPLTGIFLIVEITGSYNLALPLIVVSSISSSVCHYFEPASIYLKDLVEKGQLLRPGTDARVLADLSIRELLETDCIRVRHDMLLRDFIQMIKISKRNFFPVESAKGQFVGMVHLDDIRPYLMDSVMYDTVIIEQIMTPNPHTADLDTELSDVLHQMDRVGAFSMPVVSHGRFVGMISKATLLDKYRKELILQTTH